MRMLICSMVLEYLPTFTQKSPSYVGKYTIHRHVSLDVSSDEVVKLDITAKAFLYISTASSRYLLYMVKMFSRCF